MGVNVFQNQNLVREHSEDLTYSIILMIMRVAFILQGSNVKYIEKELLSERPTSLFKWAIIYVLYLPVKLFKHLT